MKSRRIALVLLMMAVCAALAVTPLFTRSNGSSAPVDEAAAALPAHVQAPAFVLTDCTGSEFDSKELIGKIWVADFFFTSCPTVCPVMVAHMRELQQRFADDEGIRFVSISVDPETDTPEAMAKFAEYNNIDTSQWHLLRGDLSEVHRITAGFQIAVPDNPMGHSQRFILIDDRGTVRGYYHGMERPSIDLVANDIAKLKNETAGG